MTGISGGLRDPMGEPSQTGGRGFTWILTTRDLERAALWLIHALDSMKLAYSSEGDAIAERLSRWPSFGSRLH